MDMAIIEVTIAEVVLHQECLVDLQIPNRLMDQGIVDGHQYPQRAEDDQSQAMSQHHHSWNLARHRLVQLVVIALSQWGIGQKVLPCYHMVDQ